MKILRFSAVGGVGFIFDGGILSLLAQVFGWNVFLARGVSFALATLVTWHLNRSFVFTPDAPLVDTRGLEYLRYLTIQIVGASVNLGVFILSIGIIPELRSIPIVPLAIGAAFGLIVNFLGAHYWVFRTTESGA